MNAAVLHVRSVGVNARGWAVENACCKPIEQFLYYPLMNGLMQRKIRALVDAMGFRNSLSRWQCGTLIVYWRASLLMLMLRQHWFQLTAGI